MTVTRSTLEELPRLDVRVLARAGALARGVTATVTWGDGAAITTTVPANTPETVMVRYAVVTSDGAGSPVEEPIGLTDTACTFGGSRAWFACPGCLSRVAVLYALGGRFRCRTCHDLAYASTRSPSVTRQGRW